MGKIEQNKEKKRREILASAKSVFLTEGYVLASMDKIATNAKMTKQTVYRYYPSKIDLFQSTLKDMGNSLDESFLTHLEKADTKLALLNFAIDFITFHLSDEHIATFRLLVAESTKAPEIVGIFHQVGPDQTDQQLAAFFKQRLGMEEPEATVKLWTGMLLSLRTGVLMGMEKPNAQAIEKHAKDATEFLFSAITSNQ
ncbi:TetR/AcrR family transcriptional regulator [Photobacterium sp. BZF1]|uniref:TetR/AcrR family transcriptional regulator n=1 Tax=Photobacterium sp. BZF1 TaxID=1904457 RepID=UPI0016538D2B|nr:TetR/AcrR family transcriptional regulator [Photobacterium sp. BZF1]MBC7006057.1 TetR/AcrR family transcriptional regulator [Photobacterium sp. BZF1]